ncbi:MAG: bifunctional methylenetetrahydrofolate dehydrogenase/methenyltetrahydrofolate cyclohydrolase FolD [Deltaproteobacteria bacterium]|nr:bifunctional methylenetetrahydrofolate dehydrogenase/methenyltetrahydrofolate cyclohydrolase FolD [Deltaproteobacteria bacterium]
MTATIIDGKAVAARVRAEVALETSQFRDAHGRAPSLHVVLVGDDPASQVYVRNKEKAARDVGIDGVTHRLAATTSEAELLALVDQLTNDDGVDGILVQMPLPKGLSEHRVLDRIAPSKDVDGLHPVNAGLLASGREALVPCTPQGCIRLIDETGTELRGLRAVVVGRSILVGKPVAQLLLARHATVTIAHSRTRDLADVCRSADVLVAAVGKLRLIKGDWIKPGAIVIDVGMNKGEDGKLCGDVDYGPASEAARAITPVPGGVGPMTIAYLLKNTVAAARARVA